MTNPKRKVLRLAVVAMALGLVGCGNRYDVGAGGAGGRETLTIKGSDTMVILAQRWAEGFMAENSNTTVQVSGGGSGTGIAALINGTTELANSSRAIKPREQAHIAKNRGAEAVEHRVAIDAIAIYVSDGNPIRTLDLDQLKRIFRGQIRNWKELGGLDMPIVLYSRENNSGTYAYFKEKVLNDEDFAAEAQTLPGTAAVINAIAKDPKGIGYGGIAFGEGVHPVKIGEPGQEPKSPSLQNAVEGNYPLSRFLFIYTAGKPTGPAKRYLDFILSDMGQSVVEGVGYYPLPREARPGVAPSPSNPE